mmetsp:Transcript_17984/g.37300  ORF Transcript_17984/g.37300 Transcript_17984/m.37300 type:complete len:236 (-) Transcript_17984:1081-1788(-)
MTWDTVRWIKLERGKAGKSSSIRETRAIQLKSARAASSCSATSLLVDAVDVVDASTISLIISRNAISACRAPSDATSECLCRSSIIAKCITLPRRKARNGTNASFSASVLIAFASLLRASRKLRRRNWNKKKRLARSRYRSDSSADRALLNIDSIFDTAIKGSRRSRARLIACCGHSSDPLLLGVTLPVNTILRPNSPKSMVQRSARRKHSTASRCGYIALASEAAEQNALLTHS